jgi:hypothetical protein
MGITCDRQIVKINYGGRNTMTKQELDEAREVFTGIMDEMDCHGDPDDLGVYRNIREIFETGVMICARPAPDHGVKMGNAGNAQRRRNHDLRNFY